MYEAVTTAAVTTEPIAAAAGLSATIPILSAVAAAAISAAVTAAKSDSLAAPTITSAPKSTSKSISTRAHEH
jgi:hypothetical protein